MIEAGQRMLALFHGLIAVHITTGTVGLVAFWVPIFGRKGGPIHTRWGRVFGYAILATAASAFAMSVLTLVAPMATHPHLVGHPELSDPDLVRAIFGWMMLYLSVLTVNLTWYGWGCIKNKRNHSANRGWFNLSLQAAVVVLAANCAYHGVVMNQMLLVGISFIGFATAATNLWYIYDSRPSPKAWLKEHIKAIVGSGISIYTAFLAFGAVRLMPDAALSPALWAVPLVVGLAIILYHRRRIDVSMRARQPRSEGVGA